MAFDIGELLGRLKLDSSQFDQGVKEGEQKLTGLAGMADKLHGAMSSIFSGVGMFAGNAAMTGLSSALGFAKDAVFGFNSELENSGIAFTTMLGSAQKSKAFLDQLKQFAKSTPFEFGDLVTDAQNMMGMGIAAKDVIPDLTALGDSVASVGGSATQVKQVTLAFDQMAAKGTVDLGNMNQLMEGGVPNALKIMAAGYHVTTGAMIQMISTGKVQSDVALPMLIQGLEKGTSATAALGGMMDKQSATFSGALSNISDGLQQAMAGAFKPFFDVASQGAQKLGAFFSSSSFSAFGDRISAALSGAMKSLQGIDLSAVGGAFMFVVNIIKTDLIPAGQDIYKTFGPLVRDAFAQAGNAMGPLKGTIGVVGAALKDTFGFIDAHKTTFQALAVTILTIVAAQKAWTIATTIWSAVTTAATAVQTAFDVAMDANPIGLVILAIAGLAAGIYYLWTHSAAFRDFFIGVWQSIWVPMKAIGAWFAGPFADFFVNTWNAISAGALWLWHNVLDPFWQGLMSAVAFVQNIVTSFANLWAFIWVNTIGAAILWMWHSVWDPMVQGISAGALWLYHNVLEPVGQGFVMTFNGIATGALWLWHNVLDPVWHGIAAGAGWVAGMISTAFGAIMTAVHWIGDGFKSVFGAIGGYIASALGGAIGIAKGAINGVISLLNSAIGDVNSVINMANHIPGVSFPHIPSIPHLAVGGAVQPRPGGTPVVMGDGGQVEYGVPKSDMQAIIGQAVAAAQGSGGGTLRVIIEGTGILRGIREEVRVQGGDVQTVLVGG